MTDDKFLRKRFSELAERAYTSGRYTYTDFLGLQETDVLMRMKNEILYAGLTLYGGDDGCERRIARFGFDTTGFKEQSFPIVLITAEPLDKKFADKLTHRDVLGALMNLGIERDLIGDIFIKDNVVYFFSLERISNMLISDFTKAKHTSLRCRIIDSLPGDAGSEAVEQCVKIASERADVLIAAVYLMSREECCELFREKRVFINGRQCENNSETVKTGTLISVRGCGRFRYLGYETLSKKGKLNAKVEKWV